MTGGDRAFGTGFAPNRTGAAAPCSLCCPTGNEPEQCRRRRRARGFLGALFAYSRTEVYTILGEKGVFQPGCCPDPSHGDGTGDIPIPGPARAWAIGRERAPVEQRHGGVTLPINQIRWPYAGTDAVKLWTAAG